MQGKFVVDDTRIKAFQRQSIKIFILPMGIVLVPMLILFMMGKTPLVGIGLVAIVAFVGFGAFMLGIESLEKIKIFLEPTVIRREGRGTYLAEIKYSDIGRIIIKSNGLVIVKKGFQANLNYYVSRSPLKRCSDVIFIPSMIKDYDLIRNFLLDHPKLDV